MSPWAMAPSGARPSPSLPVGSSGRWLSEWRGGTVVAAEAAGVKQCTLTMHGASARSVGYCAAVVRGPLLITDVHAGGGCRADLYALGGSLAHPAWVVFVPAGTSAHLTGASLAVLDEGELIIGVVGASEGSIAHDLRCSLTWSGWAAAPSSVSGVGLGPVHLDPAWSDPLLESPPGSPVRDSGF